MKRLLAAALAAAMSCSHAMNVGTPQTYSDLRWVSSFNAQAFVHCTELVFDATGDLVNSNRLSIYGTLNCPYLGGGYSMTGVLYVGTDNSLNITMTVAGFTINCPRVVSWVGNCNVLDASNVMRGTGTIRLI